MKRFRLNAEHAMRARNGGTVSVGGGKVKVHTFTTRNWNEVIEGEVWSRFAPDILVEVFDVKPGEETAPKILLEIPPVFNVENALEAHAKVVEVSDDEQEGDLSFLLEGGDEVPGDDSRSSDNGDFYVPNTRSELEGMTIADLKALALELDVFDKVPSSKTGYKSKPDFIMVIAEVLGM